MDERERLKDTERVYRDEESEEPEVEAHQLDLDRTKDRVKDRDADDEGRDRTKDRVKD